MEQQSPAQDIQEIVLGAIPQIFQPHSAPNTRVALDVGQELVDYHVNHIKTVSGDPLAKNKLELSLYFTGTLVRESNRFAPLPEDEEKEALGRIAGGTRALIAQNMGELLARSWDGSRLKYLIEAGTEEEFLQRAKELADYEG